MCPLSELLGLRREENLEHLSVSNKVFSLSLLQVLRKEDDLEHLYTVSNKMYRISLSYRC
jgi:hypothetical protein